MFKQKRMAMYKLTTPHHTLSLDTAVVTTSNGNGYMQTPSVKKFFSFVQIQNTNYTIASWFPPNSYLFFLIKLFINVKAFCITC